MGQASEAAALDQQTRALGFDPTQTPERCVSNSSALAHDAKRVCAGLGIDHARKREALQNTDRLKQATECGAAAFTDEFQRRVVPLLAGGRRA